MANLTMPAFAMAAFVLHLQASDMTNVLILGANGSVARVAIDRS